LLRPYSGRRTGGAFAVPGSGRPGSGRLARPLYAGSLPVAPVARSGYREAQRRRRTGFWPGRCSLTSPPEWPVTGGQMIPRILKSLTLILFVVSATQAQAQSGPEEFLSSFGQEAIAQLTDASVPEAQREAQ